MNEGQQLQQAYSEVVVVPPDEDTLDGFMYSMGLDVVLWPMASLVAMLLVTHRIVAFRRVAVNVGAASKND